MKNEKTKEKVFFIKNFLAVFLQFAICILLWAAPVAAATRHLATDCTYSGAFVPSEAAPFDLDWCTLNDGDEVTQLLTEIRAQWPSGFAVRAPSKTLSVVSDYIVWPTATKFYYFLEDQNPANKLIVQHKVTDPQTCVGAACNGFWVMWHFENFNTVKIGGPNLSITLRGNHPGLANCDVQTPLMLSLGYDPVTAAICDANKGLIEFHMSDGSLATLADVRADIKFAQQYSIYTWGSFIEGGVTDKIQQFNVAGLHYATSGVFFHQGVKNAWADLTLSDPYVRALGWTGAVPGQTQGGLSMGCNDSSRDQVRFMGFSGFYTDSITGGVTFEYGYYNWVQRFTGRVGTSAADPFVVRIKDFGVSGPGTGYPAGVRVKKAIEANFFKGDPHERPADSGSMRFVRFEKLADTYGSGPADDSLVGCSPSSAFPDAPDNFMRLENSVIGKVNRGWYVILDGDWDTNFRRGDLFRFAFDEENDDARSYGHTLEAASGTTITDLITMYDTDTTTGAGTFTNIRISTYNMATIGQDNVITDTNMAGTVTISANTVRTTIRNVNFSGPARAIISIGSSADVTVSNICAASGSTITGAGTATYNGASITLPYTFSSGASECSTGNPPNPCDANADGTTDVLDMQLVVNQALGVAACSADINLDSVCNVIDVQRVVNAAMTGTCVSP